MRARAPLRALLPMLAPVVGACAGGASGPPSLAYGLPRPAAASYSVADTMVIGIEALGQRLAVEAQSLAEYDLSFQLAGAGVRVVLGLRALDAQVEVPMAGAMRFDESIATGELVIALDPMGESTIEASPEVEEAATLFFSGAALAQVFFPGLPGSAVRAGDTWTDSVTRADTGETGQTSMTLRLDYRVVGEVEEDGRRMLDIAFSGTESTSQSASVQGMAMEQSMTLDVEGRFQWDLERRLMYGKETRSSGTGTLRIAGMPGTLPTRIEAAQRVRLVAP